MLLCKGCVWKDRVGGKEGGREKRRGRERDAEMGERLYIHRHLLSVEDSHLSRAKGPEEEAKLEKGR